MRNEYRNLDTGKIRTGDTGRGESLTDVEHYLMPVDQARNSALYSWGVAEGMTVSASSGQAGIRVSAGTAIDQAGRLLLLVIGGVAITDPDVDPDSAKNMPTVSVDANGVLLETATQDPAGVAGDYLLTLTFHEAASMGTDANGPVRLHAPWLRLEKAAGFQGSEHQVPLAAVSLASDGSVTAVTAGPRQAVSVPAGLVELRTPRSGSGPGLTVEHAAVAELRARTDGGVDLTLTSGPGNQRTALTVEGATGAVAVFGELKLSGPPVGGGRTYAMSSGPNGRWHFRDETNQAERLMIDADGRVVIGAAAGQRALHVEGTEIHSGGSMGGFSFADRTVSAFVDTPAAGERWVWYAANGTARLWSGSDRLTIEPGGLDVAGLLLVNGREVVQATDAWLRLNQSMESANGVHTPGLFAPGSLNVGGLDGWISPGPGNAWISGQARIAGGGLLAGVVVGRDAPGVDYLYEYETVGVAAPNFNLRLQSPNSVFVHAGGDERLVVSAGGADLRGMLWNAGREMLRGDDPWMRLNQAGQFPNGVHTPAAFSCGSLNVGGVEGWGNPGGANVWIGGQLIVHGRVQLGADDEVVVVGGNQTGPFMQLHDDLWLADPQDGTIELLDATQTRPGRLRGLFLSQSSRADKRDIQPLGPGDLEELLADALATEVVRYRWKGEDASGPPRLGVIAEQVPRYMAGDEGKSVSLAEYSTLLLGAVQVLARRVSALEREHHG
jgi:hypothetical protein